MCFFFLRHFWNTSVSALLDLPTVKKITTQNQFPPPARFWIVCRFCMTVNGMKCLQYDDRSAVKTFAQDIRMSASCSLHDMEHQGDAMVCWIFPNCCFCYNKQEKNSPAAPVARCISLTKIVQFIVLPPHHHIISGFLIRVCADKYLLWDFWPWACSIPGTLFFWLFFIVCLFYSSRNMIFLGTFHHGLFGCPMVYGEKSFLFIYFVLIHWTFS